MIVFINPIKSIIIYPRYITVNPKLLRENAALINNTLAVRKNMYAQNIGGVGEYHIKTMLAIKLEIIPVTSTQNLTG